MDGWILSIAGSKLTKSINLTKWSTSIILVWQMQVILYLFIVIDSINFFSDGNEG